MFSRFAVPTSFSRASRLSLVSTSSATTPVFVLQTVWPSAQRQLHHSGLNVLETSISHQLLKPDAYPAVLFRLYTLQE